MNGEAPKHFPALDGLRGVAALFVAWLHLVDPDGVLAVPKGYLAVDLFFVLSGAVMASAYEQRLRAGNFARELFVIRVVRLYPLYFFGSVLGATGMALGAPSHLTLGKAALALVMIPEWGSIYQASFPLDDPTWSLFFEFWVNMFYGYFLARLNVGIVASLMAVSVGGIVAIVVFSQAHNVAVGWTFATLPHGVFRTVYPFFAGVLLSRLHVSRSLVPFTGDRSTQCTMLLLLATAGLLCARPPASLSGAYDLVCVIALFPLLVHFGMRLNPSEGVVRVCATLGVISYPMYCIHWPLIMLLRMRREGPYVNGLVAALTFLVAVAALSYALNHVYDAPVRRWILRLLLANSVIGWVRPPRPFDTSSSIGRRAASSKMGSLDPAARE